MSTMSNTIDPDSTDALHEALILPDWPVRGRVRAVSTTRRGGVSKPPCDSLNLGYGAQDEREAVTENRRRLRNILTLPAEPAWVQQVHGDTVVAAEDVAADEPPAADASVSRTPGLASVVMTADCLPVLFCDREGTTVGAAHAGWRGLVRGILPATVTAMDRPPEDLMAWLGPAIGPDVYEVGPEVRESFLDQDPTHGESFRPSPAGRWLADLYAIARRQLHGLGVTAVYGGEFCTYSDPDRFYSYRRDGSSGRMASLIWLAD